MRRGEGNTHPTVKPLKLIEYLAKLILPAKQGRTKRKLLVPFSGSGSEMIGALRAGWDDVTGIEISPEYIAMAEQRLARSAHAASSTDRDIRNKRQSMSRKAAA